MFSVKKNHVLAAVLVVMIATAGYLNFHQPSGDTASNYDSSKEYGYNNLLDDSTISTIADDTDQSDPITAQTSSDKAATTATASTAQNDDDTGAAVFVNNPNVDDASSYFVEAKLDREQNRSKQKDMLQGMINNSSLSDKEKEECANNMLKLQERMEKESASEDMIKAKGFKEAYVRIDDDTVDVVVDAKSLTEQQAAQIEDIVKRKTGYTADKIRITTIKK
ncbi:MAG: SpoIIIAH-like family protein [Clostridia bacterium]|jgi:stage III sporulation protein AH|nr:SpoIIIAH-like family protein [Clostridia bacterium]